MMADDSTDHANPKELSPVDVIGRLWNIRLSAHGHVQEATELVAVALENARELERSRDHMALLRALSAIGEGLPITEDECKRALAAITRMGNEVKRG